MNSIDLHFFPGWTRKSISFTIDDGNIAMDEKFLSIVKPAGIKGTFNLCTPLKNHMSDEDYRRFYRGFEIANHCRRHPHPFSPRISPKIVTEPFCEETADKSCAYPTEEEGLYRIFQSNWNYYVATNEKYMELTDTCTKELEQVFGKDTIKDFVWPFGEQNNPAVMQALIDRGFRSIRATGDVGDSTGFALPRDRMHWSYNAHHKTLLRTAPLYDAFPDDGELKLFCFGVHSIDFERDGNWGDLETFCEEYGNRSDFWYAAMGDIFDYEDAVKAVTVSDEEIKNNSGIDLYIKINGKKKILSAYSTIQL